MAKDLLTPDERPSLRDAPLAEAAVSTRNGNCMLRWAGGATFVLSLISIGLACGSARVPGNWIVLQSEWAIWLLALQTFGLLALLRRFGRPATRRSGICLIILNCWLLGLGGFYQLGALDYALAIAADLSLRATMLGLW